MIGWILRWIQSVSEKIIICLENNLKIHFPRAELCLLQRETFDHCRATGE